MEITNFIESKLEVIQSNTIISLIIIIAIGASIRVFFTPWHLPTNSFDSLIFMIEGLAYSNGDFHNLSHRFFWPGILSIFFKFFEFENHLEYTTIVRIISISISVSTIPIIFLISKKFMKEKYALFVSVILTIEPNLIENSIFGVTEPLLIFLGTLSFYCILQEQRKFHILAFVFAGLAFDTRLNGIVLLLLLIFTLILKRERKLKNKDFIIGIILFLIIIFPTNIIIPMLGDEKIFSYLLPISKAIFEGEVTYSTYQGTEISTPGNTMINSLKNEFLSILRISIPFLLILFPIGIILSLKNMDYQKKILFSIIIISLIIAIPQYTVSNEYRNLLFLIPFLCIFSGIGIEKISEKIEMKNIFLLVLVGGLLFLSVCFLNDRYNIDEQYFIEKDNFAKYVVNNFEGNISGNLRLEIVRNIPNLVVTSTHYNEKINFHDPGIVIDSNSKLIEYLQNNEIDYLVIEERYNEKHFPIFNKILIHEEEYDFLNEVINSNDLGYKKLHVKIFIINWSEYDGKQ